MNGLKSLKQNNNLVISGVIFITIVLTLHNYLLGTMQVPDEQWMTTHYNNFKIFRNSFFHLIQQQDLYGFYKSEHLDLFKYSPTFAFLMAPIAVLHEILGLLAWNLLNALIFFFGFWKLPFKTDRTKLLAFGFLIIEMITSLQNLQSNCLIAGLLLFAFFMMERKKVALAALFIVLTIFIKLFGIVALSLFLLYPNKGKAILYTIVWTLLLGILPLVVVPPSHLIVLYQSWFTLLINDHAVPNGLSVFGWLNTWFHIDNANFVIMAIGVIMLLIPLINYRFFTEEKFRLMFFAGVLLWIVIFNHKAESPTYIIACTGVAIWFFFREFKIENLILTGLVLIFTIFSPTDLFPPNGIVDSYCLKAVPCILVWMKLSYDMLRYSYTT